MHAQGDAAKCQERRYVCELVGLAAVDATVSRPALTATTKLALAMLASRPTAISPSALKFTHRNQDPLLSLFSYSFFMVLSLIFRHFKY